MIGLISLAYVLGFFISLWAFHTFKNELDINHYDPPHPEDYDDYDSNASAYVAFSLMWPIFWTITILGLIWDGLLFISKKFENA